MKNFFLIFGVFMVAVSTSNSQIITDRPDQTESSSSVNKGSLQIESGIVLTFTEDALSSQRQLLAPTTLFRYGILKGLEIRVLNQFESVKVQNSLQTISGISDLEVGTKVQIFKKETVNTEVAFLSHVIFPTGSKALSNDKFGTINKLSISHEINDNMSLGYNLGYDYFGESSGDFTYSVALGFGVSKTFSIYVEPYGRYLNFDTYQSSFDAGVTYLLNNDCQFDFSFGTGINHTMNYISLGFSIQIAKENEL